MFVCICLLKSVREYNYWYPYIYVFVREFWVQVGVTDFSSPVTVDFRFVGSWNLLDGREQSAFRSTLPSDLWDSLGFP